jgi:ABC-2 type transport system permease protein
MTDDFEIKGSKAGFSMIRMTTVTSRVLKQLIRDRRTFGMILVMPILIMLIFGYALSGEVNNVPMLVINEDSTQFGMNVGNNITELLISDDRVAVTESDIRMEDARKLVDEGSYSAVLYIPSDLTQKLGQKMLNPNLNISITLELYLDGTKPTIRASILNSVQQSIQEIFEDVLGEQIIQVEEEFAFGGSEYSGIDVAISSVIALVLTFLILMVSLITIIREQLYGTHARLYTTPLTKFEKLFGFTIALSVIGILMVLSVVLIGVYLFGVTVRGNFFLLLATAFLYSIVHILLAVFLSNFAKNELQAVQFAPLISFPSMALSGMLVPINTLPHFAQILSSFMPMTYGIIIFEGIMLKGLGFYEILEPLVYLVLFGLVFLFLALITVKDWLD